MLLLQKLGQNGVADLHDPDGNLVHVAHPLG
jgi:hypothetical protein